MKRRIVASREDESPRVFSGAEKGQEGGVSIMPLAFPVTVVPLLLELELGVLEGKCHVLSSDVSTWLSSYFQALITVN
ncbi:hypothetical protein NL676_002404 [Syzygium grande]|nr:hypothetical protein NL676_002404 [Syzygium grande]